MMSSSWPALGYEAWSATCDTLHAHTQILGKLAVELAPPEPQLQHSALRLTPRGWETQTLPARRWVRRLLSCEPDVPLARLPGWHLVLATSQLSYVRAFSQVKARLRDWQLVPATSRLSCVRVFSPLTPRLRDWQRAQAKSQLSYVRVFSLAKLKLRGWSLAKPQLSSYGPSLLAKRMLRGWHWAKSGFVPQPGKRPQE